MQGPSTFNNIIVNTVVVDGANGGVFLYNGTPGPGNPPVLSEVAPGVTQDPYGNTIKAVLLVGPAAGPFTQIDQFGDIICFSPTGGSIVLDPSKPQIELFDLLGALHVLINNQGEFSYFPNTGPGNLIAASAGTAGTDANSNAYATGITGTISTWQPGVSPQVVETWHTMTLNAGFAAGGTTPQYKRYPDKTAGLRGAVNLTASEAANTTFFTLPSAAYRPTGTHHFVTQASLSGNSLGSATLSVLTTGDLQIAVAGGSGGFINLDGVRWPVD